MNRLHDGACAQDVQQLIELLRAALPHVGAQAGLLDPETAEGIGARTLAAAIHEKVEAPVPTWCCCPDGRTRSLGLTVIEKSAGECL